jgi:hypothetical protein
MSHEPMDHEEPVDLDFNDVPDVASTPLSALLRRDPALDSAIRDLISQLKNPPEVTLGWNNLARYIASTDTSSTG